ncbi:sortase (surface protein transpeptidase) [Amycolatopsis lexingtonensis]|uniref:Sortase (Surface protein transpeptidase) n=1 Tax=Amycolatopsis lexingtonensis TaxID=218822 RepID=A0ABR9HSV4_9PSEU|nr:class F sortase [Amycolatopsis lexingtonensis]MBE1494011.1 sortase (surface protein transpeptidase) [Amycolatopsis lexingtonensis]
MTGASRLHGRRGALLLATVVLAALAALTLVLTAGRNREPGTAAPTAPSSSSIEQSSAAAELPRSDPTSVEVPKIGAKSSLVALGLNPDGTLEVPPVSKPMQAGWYSLGPTPGEAGPAVLVGHVDGNRQKGIFYRLREVAPGDRVLVTRKDGTTLTFVVARTQQIDKDEFPSDAVYGDTPDPQLRLITCGGSFDRSVHSYRDNIIVYAKLAP